MSEADVTLHACIRLKTKYFCGGSPCMHKEDKQTVDSVNAQMSWAITLPSEVQCECA